jgi:maltoporin
LGQRVGAAAARKASRRVLRAFITYAQWSDAFVGQVGGQDCEGLNNGFTYGLQMETWW